MKNPRQTIWAVAVLMLFSSCQREHIIGTEKTPRPQSEFNVETRCCDDLSADILSNELYQEAWDNFRIGLIEPSVSLLEALDTGYIFTVVRQYEACILSGQPIEECAQDFVDALEVKQFLFNMNLWQFDSLRLEYAEVPDAEFYASLEEAIAASLLSQVDDRQITCFTAYQSAVRSSSAGIVKVFGATSQIGAAAAAIITAINLATAYADFCACLYNNYGAGC